MTQLSVSLGNVHEQFNRLAPINRLPNELLIYIFTLLPIPSYGLRGYRVLGIIVISSVCQRWRQLVIRTGSLWSMIDFRRWRWQKYVASNDGIYETISDVDGFSHIARMCLARSNNSGLDIAFDALYLAPLELLSAAVEVVLPAFSRWEMLTLDGCTHGGLHVLHVLSRFLDTCFSNPAQQLRLRSLRLTRPRDGVRGFEGAILALLVLAPSLRSLELKGIKLALPASVAQSLTHLSLEHYYGHTNITPTDLDIILRQCTRLRSLKIEQVGIRAGVLLENAPTQILLPDLEDMYILQPTPNAIQMFIYQNVVTPSLQNFAILFTKTWAVEYVAQSRLLDAMVTFLASTPSIETFRYARLPLVHLSNALRVLPQLRTLIFGFGDLGWPAISDLEMTFEVPPPDVCPQLSEIRIDTTIGNGIVRFYKLVGLRRFLEDRSAFSAVTPLRALSVRCYLESLGQASDDELKEWFSSRLDLVWAPIMSDV